MVRTTEDLLKTPEPKAPESMYREEPPVLVTKGGPGRIKVIWRDERARDEVRSKGRMDQQDIWLVGKGFEPLPTEVVLEFFGSSIDRARISTWTEDGTFRVQLPHFDMAGEFTIRAYVPITAYGVSEPDDHRREMMLTDEVKVTVEPMPV